MSMIDLEPLPGTTDGRMRVARLGGVRVTMGLYRITWEDGGQSLAAIGMMSDGQWWVAPTNWLRSAEPLEIDNPQNICWQDIARIERIDAALAQGGERE